MYLKDISQEDMHKYKFCLQREKDIVATKESSADQIILLKSDNIVSDEAHGRDFAALGSTPRPIAGQLDYLARYRPHGKK